MSDETLALSEEAQGILDRLRDHYRDTGRASTAATYYRVLKKFFTWAESKGFTVKSLPATSVETFLEETGKGLAPATIYLTRTQLKSALREAHASLGVDFAHLEYQTGKPPEVQKVKREGDKKRKAKQAQAAANPFDQSEQSPGVSGHSEVDMNDVTPQSVPVAAQGSTPQQLQIVVQQQPAPSRKEQKQQNHNQPQQNQQQQNTNAAPGGMARGVTINNHIFTGAFVKISRIADGSDPFIPPGSETYVATMPASQLAPHGDIGQFLQSFVIPNLRLSASVSQVHFVFHELNDRKQPTGRRDELIVTVPMLAGTQGGSMGAVGMPGVTSFMGPHTPAPAQQMDKSTEYLLNRLDKEADEARKRAEGLEAKLADARDQSTMMMLMQQMRREQELQRELENKRAEALFSARAPAPMPPPMPLMPLPPEPRPDGGAEMAKAFAEAQSRMVEAVMTRNSQQKDAADWLVPMMTTMAQMQQAQQQMQMQMAAENMKMMMQMQQLQAQQSQASNDRFMQLMMANNSKESPELVLIREQLRQREQQIAALSQRGDDLEDFADKLQKMKIVGEMVNGGGGGGGNILNTIVENLPGISAGAAQVLAAMKGQQIPENPALAGNEEEEQEEPQQVVQRPQIAAQRSAPTQQAPVQQAQTQPQGQSQEGDLQVPENVANALAFLSRDEASDDQQVNGFVAYIKGLMQAGHEFFTRQADRLVGAFRRADDEDDLYTLSKHLWIAIGQKPNKDAARRLAHTLAVYYSDIHAAMLGEPRDLPEPPEDDEEESEEAEEVQAQSPAPKPALKAVTAAPAAPTPATANVATLNA